MSCKGKAESSAEELSKKLDQIIRRLDLLEELILDKPEYESLTVSLRLTKMGIGDMLRSGSKGESSGKAGEQIGEEIERKIRQKMDEKSREKEEEDDEED